MYIRYRTLNEDKDNFNQSEVVKIKAIQYWDDIEATVIDFADDDYYPIILPMTSDEHERFLDKVCSRVRNDGNILYLTGGVTEWFEWDDLEDTEDEAEENRLIKDTKDRADIVKNLNSRLFGIASYEVKVV